MSHRNAHLSMVLVFGVMTLLTMGAHPQHYLVCHKRKGTYKKMMVPTPALKGHLKHGDYIWQNESDSLYCEDGIDNDCDGMVDMDEPACPYALCEEVCFIASNECIDVCLFDRFGEFCQGPGSDPDCNNIFTENCDPACLQKLAECQKPCDENYTSCVNQCPATP